MTRPAFRSAADYDPEWLREHLAEERRRTELLGEIREAIFGAQDGLVSTLTVVGAVGGATHQTFAVLVAGIASALAGVFAMAVGEYTSSKSQREIFEFEIAGEREEVRDRPEEAEAEVAYMLQQEGLDRETALRVANDMATEPEVLLRTMVEKEHGLTVEPQESALRGALVMGATFGLGSLVPIFPYAFLRVDDAVWLSVALTATVVFAIGWVKARWSARSPLASGLEILVLTAVAGVAAHFFGSLLPGFLGVTVPNV